MLALYVGFYIFKKFIKIKQIWNHKLSCRKITKNRGGGPLNWQIINNEKFLDYQSLKLMKILTLEKLLKKKI